jgi:hypothetical protein
LATVLTKRSANIYILPAAGNDSGVAKPLLSQRNDIFTFNWTADGDLLATDSGRLLKIGMDGKNQTQLLADSSASMASPSACGSNYFVFTWIFHGDTPGANIWRANTDGSSPLKLTNGNTDYVPVCSPNQKWVYYYDLSHGSMLRVQLDGSGKPEAVPGSSTSSVYYADTQNPMWFSCKSLNSRAPVGKISLERRRPRHPHPEASQSGVREAAVVSLRYRPPSIARFARRGEILNCRNQAIAQVCAVCSPPKAKWCAAARGF